MSEIFGINLKRLIDETEFILPYCKSSHVQTDTSWDKEFIYSDIPKNAVAPVISVAILAYNSERTIANCIEGVLAQKLACSFEIVISDDCATDKTRSICTQYRNKYPGIIRILESESNVGVAKNLMRALIACRGEYIACIDGDDFYCHPGKLQMQVDYLRQHLDVSMVFGGIDMQLENFRSTRVHYSSKSRALRRALNNCQKEEWSRRCAFYNPVCTITPLLRRSSLKCVINGIHELFALCKWLPVQDLAAWFFASQAGKVFYMDEIFGVYRMSVSSHTGITDARRMLINMLGDERMRVGLMMLAPNLFKEEDVHRVVIQMILLTYELLSSSAIKPNNIAYLRELADLFKERIGIEFYNAIVHGNKSPFALRTARRLRETKRMRKFYYFILKKIAVNFLGL